MYFNPYRLSVDECNRIARWMEMNGCRDWIALEPIVVRGSIAEYTSVCRKGRASHIKICDDAFLYEGRKRLRIRIPLKDVTCCPSL